MTEENKVLSMAAPRAERLEIAVTPEERTAVQVAEMGRKMDRLLDTMARMEQVMLGQAQQIAKLSAAMQTVRVSRSQELAIQSAIRERAKNLCFAEDIFGMERRVASAIRTTIRETTGARAIGDIQEGQFDRVMALIDSWYMRGAIRKIKKEAGRT